jgi:hypothetical protein
MLIAITDQGLAELVEVVGAVGVRARSRLVLMVGMRMDARMAMIAMTTSISIRVKARRNE